MILLRELKVKNGLLSFFFRIKEKSPIVLIIVIKNIVTVATEVGPLKHI